RHTRFSRDWSSDVCSSDLVGDLGCLSKYDGKIMLLMDSGDTFTFMQNSDTDCGSNSYFTNYLMLSEDQAVLPNWREILLENFNEIANSKVKKVRVYATKGYLDIEVRSE